MSDSPPTPGFVDRLSELRATAMQVTVDTGPDPVYEPSAEAEQAYYDCQQFLWRHAEAILALVEAVATLPDSLSYSVDAKYWTGVPREALADLRAKWEALNNG